ncbi:hypothetical protein AVEN_51261-1, partial [Araneus ventricosus]
GIQRNIQELSIPLFCNTLGQTPSKCKELVKVGVDKGKRWIFSRFGYSFGPLGGVSIGHCPFPSYLYRFRLHHSDTCAYWEKEYSLHYATCCHVTLSYHFTKPSAKNAQLCWKHLLSNKLSRIKIAKLISFLNENENFIKQPPDATRSSDFDTDFSPSPRPQTYGLRPSKGSITRALISPPTSL